MGSSQSSPLQMRSNHSPPLERSNTYTSQLRPTPSTFDCDLQLRKAIEENDMYEAEDWIVNEGANVNAIISPDGGTLLMLAVTIDSGSCTALLLEEGADVNARKMNGNTALMEAASRGSANCARLLLNHGADVNGANNTGVTALMMAAIRGDVESLNYLLNSGANINAINNDSNTAWMLATKFGSVECLQSLLRYEGFLDPYKVNEAINVAVSNGRYESAEVLRRHRGAGGAQRQQPPQQQRQQTAAANTPARAPPAGRFPRLFDTRSLETHPFTKSELEAMNKQEVRAVKFKLGMMGSFGPVPRHEFPDIALAIQDSLYSQPASAPEPPSAPPMPPPQAPDPPSSSGTSSRTLNRSSSSRNPQTGQMECGICDSSMSGGGEKSMATPPCGHVFCYECLVEVVKTAREGGHNKGNCPICRHQYTENQVLKLFLP